MGSKVEGSSALTCPSLKKKPLKTLISLEKETMSKHLCTVSIHQYIFVGDIGEGKITKDLLALSNDKYSLDSTHLVQRKKRRKTYLSLWEEITG